MMHFLTDFEKAVLIDTVQNKINAVALEQANLEPSAFLALYRILKKLETSEIALTPLPTAADEKAHD